MAIREIEVDTEVKRRQRIEKRRAVWDKSNGKCWFCGTQMDGKTFTVDHFVAKANGGSEDLDNLVPACIPCNGTKGDKPLEELRNKLRFKRAGMPAFSESQIAWVRDHLGEDIDPGPSAFWFECERVGYSRGDPACRRKKS